MDRHRNEHVPILTRQSITKFTFFRRNDVISSISNLKKLIISHYANKRLERQKTNKLYLLNQLTDSNSVQISFQS
jgi:hypothetical protein